MNGQTRVRNAIERKSNDRIPRFDSFWEDTVTLWEEQGMPKGIDLAEHFGFDMRTMGIDASMRLEPEVLEDDGEFITYKDRAGYTIRKMVGKSRSLEFLDHVTKDRAAWDALRDRLRFDPAGCSRLDTKSYFMHLDEYPTWDEAKEQFDALRAGGAYLCFNVYGPWEAIWRHRGFEPLMMDCLVEPDWVSEMAETHGRLVLDCLSHCLSMGMKPDGLFLVDDLAGTQGPLMSPDTWRALFKPVYAEVGAFLKREGMHFLLHCCGDCRCYLEDFIECGLDVLQPLQASAGIDVRELKESHGDRLTFWGNIDVRKLSGTDEECEVELRGKIPAAKQGGGYIYHSDHSIPPEVTYDRYRRVMALVEECGRY